MGNAIFLRADREADGTRTYKLSIGEPLQTSYGEDLYKRIFVTEKSWQITLNIILLCFCRPRFYETVRYRPDY